MGFSRRRALILAAVLLAATALAAPLLVDAMPAPAPPVLNITAAPTRLAHTAGSYAERSWPRERPARVLNCSARTDGMHW
jgi:hypothetical protein